MQLAITRNRVYTWYQQTIRSYIMSDAALDLEQLGSNVFDFTEGGF